MKNLKQLEQYRVDFPSFKGANELKALLDPETKNYAFEIPSNLSSPNTNLSITVLVSTSRTRTTIAVSTHSNQEVLRAVTTAEVYHLKSCLFNSDETLVWHFNPQLDKARELGLKAYSGQSTFDMTNFSQHFMVIDNHKFSDIDLKTAYSKKLQKNKGYQFSRGRMENEQQFVHVSTPNPFPWVDFKIIASKEFKSCNFAAVLFNEETQQFPNEYIILKL